MTITLETYGNPEKQIDRFMRQEPSVFNGEVRVERYRITIERIEEPKEVLKDRLQTLQGQPGHIDKNKHVRQEARRLGIELD